MYPCFHILRKTYGTLDVIEVLKVDDILSIVTDKFLNDEVTTETSYKYKPLHILDNSHITINGLRITNRKDGILLKQGGKIRILKDSYTPKLFSSQMTVAQYGGDNISPYICANVQFISLGRYVRNYNS